MYDHNKFLAVALFVLVGCVCQIAKAAARSSEKTVARRLRVLEAAAASDVRKHKWQKMGPEEAPGRGPIGYAKGMALSYANAYSQLKTGTVDPFVSVMAKAPMSANTNDALFALREVFARKGIHADGGSVETLRSLYVVLFELGLRETDGRFYMGIDAGPHKPRGDATDVANSTEAGLFSSSWNFAHNRPLLQQLYKDYASGTRECLAEVFKEGLTPREFKDWGNGAGADFQKLAKRCPGFAVEFAALSLRSNGAKNYYFIYHPYLEISREAERLFKDVEVIVDQE